MANERRRRWKHERLISVPAAQRNAANTWAKNQRPSWGDDFFSIPLYGENGTVTHYAADSPLTNVMLNQLTAAPKAIFSKALIEKPDPKKKGKAKLSALTSKLKVRLTKEKPEPPKPKKPHSPPH